MTKTKDKKIPAGYKMTEIGVIPEDWEVDVLGNIGESIIGLTYSPNNVCKYGKLVHRSSNVQGNKLAYDDNVFVDVSVNDKLILRENDILICVRNGSRDLIGKSAIIKGRSIGETFGAFMSVFRSEIHAYFVFYLILSNVIQRQINLSLGATINQITNKALNSFVIPIPPTVKEQKAIATVLSDMDELIEKLDRLIVKKKLIKQGTMQQLLTGKKRLPGFSGEWEVKKLGDVGDFRGGNGFPIKYQGITTGTYPFYKVSDMNNVGNELFLQSSNNWISKTVLNQINTFVFKKHSIVFAKIGAAIFLERKRILKQNSCVDNNMMAFIFDKEKYNYRFIHYLFTTIQLGKLVSATALPSLNGREISELIFQFPQLKEQKAIAQILSDMDGEIEKLEKKKEKYQQIKEGTMQVLLTGKIRLV